MGGATCGFRRWVQLGERLGRSFGCGRISLLISEPFIVHSPLKKANLLARLSSENRGTSANLEKLLDT